MALAQGRMDISEIGRAAPEDEGCSACGTKASSSFRNSKEGGRVCNSCHCKMYRQKRKIAQSGTTAAAGSQPGSRGSREARTPAALQRQRSHKRDRQYDSPTHMSTPKLLATLPTSSEAEVPAAAWAFAADSEEVAFPQLQPPSQQQQQPPSLTDLQQRVFEAAGGSSADLASLMSCASRAQRATPDILHRVVLGVLPCVRLQLPNDPAGMSHATSCLVEAVAPGATSAEQAGDSEGDSQPEAGQLLAGSCPLPEAVAIRLTVFAAAGAVACWYEAPSSAELALAFCPLNHAPMWSSGPQGFSLIFLNPFCPQVDLFAAIHHSVRLTGPAVLTLPTISLPMGARRAAAHTPRQALPPPPLARLAAALLTGAGVGVIAGAGAASYSAAAAGLLLPDLQLPAGLLQGGSSQLTGELDLELPLGAAGFEPLQLCFDPIPSGPLLSGGDGSGACGGDGGGDEMLSLLGLSPLHFDLLN